MSNAIQRPQLGQKVRTKAILTRTKSTEERKWLRFKFVERAGIYIGYRTFCDGYVSWGYEDGNEFHPHRYFEAWLVVTSPKSKPIPVLPEDVEWELSNA